MPRALLASFAALGLACACGGRTSVEDYGYRSSSNRASVVGSGGNSGGGTGGSGAGGSGAGGSGAGGSGAGGSGPNGVGAAGQNGRPPPFQEPPPVQEPPPPQEPLTCALSSSLAEGQSIQGTLNTGNGSLQSSCGGIGFEQHYLFVAQYTGLFVFDTFGSAIDTVLSVHEQDCFGAELTCNDDTNGVSSRVEVSLNEGQQVAIRVDDYGGGGGDYVLKGYGSGDLSCAIDDLGSVRGSAVYSGSLRAEADGPNTVCGGVGPTFSARWTAPFESDYLFDTIGSNFDTVLTVSPSCVGTASLGCNDDYSGLASGLTLHLLPGQPVLLMIQALGNNSSPGLDQYVLNIQSVDTFL